MTNYKSILSNLSKSNGYSRSNRFEVEFIFPSSVRQNSLDLDRLSFNCKSTMIPGRTLDVGETRYSGGYTHKKATGISFSDIELSFYLSSDMMEKHVMEYWHSQIFDYEYMNSSYPEEYQGTILMRKLDVANNHVGSYACFDAFPINIQEISQDYESNSTIDILPVTFAYHKWEWFPQ